MRKQEDLEEFEVREGMAMHEAEEEAQQRQRKGSPSSPEGDNTVSTLLKTAVEGSLTQTFTGETMQDKTN